MVTAFVSYGSNKGDRSKNIAKALDLFRKHFTLINISSFYKSEPVYTNQSGEFINGIIKIETDLSVNDLYEKLKMIERQLGRINVASNEDKPIDIDLLYYSDKVIEKPPIIVPHHKAHLRKFILTAMVDLEPDFVHPRLNKTQKQLLDELDDNKKVEKIPDLS